MQRAGDLQQFNRLKFLRFGLRTYLLLIALFASWLAVRITRNKVADRIEQISEMKQILGEVQFTSIDKFGLVKEMGHYNNDWQVFLPGNMKYQLCWSVANIAPEGFPEKVGQIELEPGRHNVRLFPSWQSKSMARSYLITLTVDGVDTVLGSIRQFTSRHDCLKDIGAPKQFTTPPSIPRSNTRVQVYQQETTKPLEIIRAIDYNNGPSGFFRQFEQTSSQENKLEFIEGVLLWIVANPIDQEAK